jgi:hypothetical protein
MLLKQVQHDGRRMGASRSASTGGFVVRPPYIVPIGFAPDGAGGVHSNIDGIKIAYRR